MDKMDIGVIEKKGHDGTKIELYRKIVLCGRAQFATELLKADIQNGEDFTTRTTFVETSIDKRVERACEAADTAFNEFEARGWILELPVPQVVPSEE